MSNVERDVDRILTLLRNKIRERGSTQLEVQEALGWGRSYISQLLTKQKSLRVEQILLILNVIDVDPGEFYSELYYFPQAEAGGAGPRTESADGSLETLDDLRSMVQVLALLLIDKRAVDRDELADAVRACEAGPDGGSIG